MQDDKCNNWDCILNEYGKKCLCVNCANCPNREIHDEQ